MNKPREIEEIRKRGIDLDQLVFEHPGLVRTELFHVKNQKQKIVWFKSDIADLTLKEFEDESK
jgi:hypothetical protein